MNNIENTFGGGKGTRVETTKNIGCEFVSLRSKSNERDS